MGKITASKNLSQTNQLRHRISINQSMRNLNHRPHALTPACYHSELTYGKQTTPVHSSTINWRFQRNGFCALFGSYALPTFAIN